MSIAAIHARDNCHQRAIYPGGIETLISTLCLGASNDLLAVCKSKEELHNIILQSNLINGPDIKSATVIFSKQPAKLIPYVGMFTIKRGIFSRSAVSAINKYIYDKCGLTNIISTIEQSEIIGINTLWFKDEWVVPFTKLDTIYEFKHSDDMRVNLNYMWIESGYIGVYRSINGKIAVQLKFKHGAVAEFVMGLQVADSFTFQNFNYTKRSVNLIMPKFKHSEKIDLESTIKQSIYAPLYTAGNLSNLTGDPTLKVSSMFQRIECEFNCAGVKAVTTRDIMHDCIRPDPLLIQFNRPFHYRIKKQDTILLAGYYDGM